QKSGGLPNVGVGVDYQENLVLPGNSFFSPKRFVSVGLFSYAFASASCSVSACAADDSVKAPTARPASQRARGRSRFLSVSSIIKSACNKEGCGF
ncbi:MAG: hypothetical protein KKB78_08190, partial [Alphaproteobacteria bacterium]|nr:hypothetical protein [Alphaproteobacteria bacterium]